MRHAAIIARRELGAYFGSPAAWWVSAAFLLAQGFSFWAIVEVLSDPRRPAPYGAVLRTHFGGNFLYWTLLVGFVVALTMRLVAEERRAGTWDVLGATSASETSVVVGKWLGALGFYAFLWLPTLLYPLLLGAYAPPGGALDGGPILSAYLGVLVTGASFCAVGLAASAATGQTLVAAVLGFVALLAWLLVGTLAETAPAWFLAEGGAGAGARLVAAVDVRRHMDDFARGVIDSRHLAVHAGVTVTALVAAAVFAGAGRRPAGKTASAAAGLALVAAAALLANALAFRHPWRGDLTAVKLYTLEPKTRGILADVGEPVRVLVVRAAGDSPFHELYDVVDELLARFHAVQPLVTIEELDPELEPGRLAELAESYHLVEEEVAGGGLVVFATPERKQAVALLDLAEWEDGAPGGGRLASFRGEAAFAAALLAVTDGARPELCLATGHGELDVAPRAGGQDLAALAAALAADGVRLSSLPDLAAGVPARCAALAIVGPREPLPGADAAAVAAHLARGGRVFVAVDAELDPGTRKLVPSGLELVLAEAGIALGDAVVVDPEKSPGIPLAWGTLWGYGAHPITAGFAGRRATYWFAPRALAAVPREGLMGPHALVSSSAAGWGERDLASLRAAGPARPTRSDADEPGPVPVAMASELPQADGGGRLVVFGSARTLTSEVIERKLGAGDLLATSAIAWLTGREALTGVGAKTPEQFRLVLDAAQRRRLLVACVGVLPALAAIAGVVVLVRRRRWA